jgi:ubiquinone/menaquinone biosynthesis C-methylase UbiE
VGVAEALPVESDWADLVASNGVLNLTTCKSSAFGEVLRVLKPGGRFQAADLILGSDLPAGLLDTPAAWST